jgi:electron transfer flavoprotein beta subunit
LKILVAVEQQCGEHALEAALRLRERGGAHVEVLAATVGGPDAEEWLLGALAVGADRAVRVWGPELEGVNDPLSVAGVLAALIGEEQPELILCGALSADGASTAMGVALAGLLDLASIVGAVAITREGDSLTVERECEGGALELLCLEMPALLSITTGSATPRQATLREIKQAASKPLQTRGTSELGIDRAAVAAIAGSRTLRVDEPGGERRVSMIDGPPDVIAWRIAQLVAAELGA